MKSEQVSAVAPGRVNLIGDHTDYMGGLAMPMAIQMATTLTAHHAKGRIDLISDAFDGRLELSLPALDPAGVLPEWGRLPAGVASLMGTTSGLEGRLSSTLPAGSGLSSSAALEIVVALALGFEGSPLELAELCRNAEQIATGVPCGLLDQLAITHGVEGSALLIDFSTDTIQTVKIPQRATFWVVHSGEQRSLSTSSYAQRRRDCESAEKLLGPLPQCSEDAIVELRNPTLRMRARHVRSECRRVRDFAESLRQADLPEAGELMNASHESLRCDFEVSTQALDRCVAELRATPGVYGARLTGAGFGGCVVALADEGVELPGWQVTPSGPAHLA